MGGRGPASKYVSDPLRGDKRAHGMAKLNRAGWPTRKIAKTFNVNLAVVEDALRRAGLQ